MAGNIYDVAADGVGAVTDFIEENPKTSIAIGTVVGIATAGVAAPAIAASIGATGVLGTTAGGTAISSLSGAALSSASLAALGGGFNRSRRSGYGWRNLCGCSRRRHCSRDR